MLQYIETWGKSAKGRYCSDTDPCGVSDVQHKRNVC